MGHHNLTLGQKVAVWARGKLGRKVGAGECWDLAEKALEHAHARTSNDLGPVDQDTDYIWGEPIADLKDVQPGDILQLRNHEVTTITKTTYTFADGSTESHTTTEIAQRGHHTAIVRAKLDANGAILTLEQHLKPLGDVVQRKTLYTRNVPPVQRKAFERHKNPTTNKVERAEVSRTVAITVTFDAIWAYRPKAK